MPPSPLLECNHVLESVGRHEGLRSLLAFSDLHQQIRKQRQPANPASDWDLFQAEHVVRDEVLQLICERAQVLMNADAVVVALAEGLEMVCRATAGPVPVPRGIRLCAQSDFLRECLESGRTLRCDDSQTDSRVELDFLQQLAARASVLVPLHGRAGRLGVLQAFSKAPWSFTDADVRCLDLLGELVLAALRPEDEDRRFQWLSKIADEVLKAKPKAAPSELTPTAVVAKTVEQPAVVEPKPSVSEIEKLTLPISIPVAASELPEVEVAAAAIADETQLTEKTSLPEEAALCAAERLEAATDEEVLTAPSFTEVSARTIGASMPQVRTHSSGASLGAASLASRPGLTAVLGLFAVAGLFWAGVWWGMQVHGKAPFAKITATASENDLSAAKGILDGRVSGTAQSAAATATASGAATGASDNLMDPAQVSQSETLQPVPESKLAALPKITGLRHWSSSVGSTVVIDMEDQVPYEVHRLMSPERIYFDLHDTVLAPELNGQTMDVGDVSLTRVRVAQPVAGVTRIVLDTKDGSNFSVSMESSPYRLVVELRNSVKSATNRPMSVGKTETSPALMAATPASALTAQALSVQPLSTQPLPARTGKFRIVLDAGHGGWDLGTVGRQGLLEKDLVLDVTRRLGKLLVARMGSEVMFTRTGDDYLPLDQRADFANQTQADLFVSVHANYSTSATARGVETYYTNTFAAPGSRELEKPADGNLVKLTPVSLSAGSLREKTEQSRRLATNVQRALYATLASKSPDIRDRGIKDASFAVLKGTTMPAILTEISFVSSPADEQNLQSEAYRQQIAEALYKGIARYEESAPHAKVAQLQPATRR